MQDEFNDPVLKAALKRACGGETAPPALRARIEHALAKEARRLPEAQRRAFDWRRSPLVGLAAAAMIIISASLLLNYYQDAEPDRLSTLPNYLASEMTAAHDLILTNANQHNLDVPKDDLDKIRQTLKNRLGHPVLVASLGDDWKLQGANLTKIGDRDGAQLVYRKGNEVVSLISVAVGGRDYAPVEGTDYRQTWEGHPMAGVVKGGAVHCIVGSKGSKLDERTLARLRDKISELISWRSGNSGCGSDTRLAAAGRV